MTVTLTWAALWLIPATITLSGAAAEIAAAIRTRSYVIGRVVIAVAYVLCAVAAGAQA